MLSCRRAGCKLRANGEWNSALGRAVSLRWKAFLVSLTVLAFVHAGLAYNGYVNLRQQYEQQGLEEFARHRAMLDELFEEAARIAQEQARALAAVASIEELSWVGELFFGFSSVRYYGEDGRQRAEWRLAGLAPNPAGLAREQDILKAALGAGAARSVVECSDGCLLRVVAPVFERGGRKVFVAASYLLSATLDQFQRLGGADVVLLGDTGGAVGEHLWGREVAALTSRAHLAPMLRQFDAVPPSPAGASTVVTGGRTFTLTMQPVELPSIGDVKAVLVVDQTARLASIALHQRNYTTLTLFGLILATAAIFILLTPSLRRLGQITQGLPLLAEQKFAEAHKLFARAARRGGFSDEIDRLNASAMALGNRLQQLMGAEAASEAKTQFLAAMSHEIRTPINGLLGLLELHEGTELSDSQRESVRIMRDSAHTLLAVVDDILDFSKVEAGKIEVHPVPMAVRDAIEGALETLAASAGSSGCT
jgi:signal transduction histidine kinase